MTLTMNTKTFGKGSLTIQSKGRIELRGEKLFIITKGTLEMIKKASGRKVPYILTCQYEKK
jgi:hypothetical protein